MLEMWSLVPLPFLNPACTSGSSWFTYSWSLAWRILSITFLAYEINTIVWQFEHSLPLAFFGIGMKTDLFQSCGYCWVFQIFSYDKCMLRHITVESPLGCKEIQPVHSEGDHPGISLEGMMLKLKLQYFGHLMRRVDSLKRLWCWEGLGAGGEGDDRGWDGWMASPTRWTWIWVNSGSWWWTGRPDVLRFLGSQRVRHDWATELNLILHIHILCLIIL